MHTYVAMFPDAGYGKNDKISGALAAAEPVMQARHGHHHHQSSRTGRIEPCSYKASVVDSDLELLAGAVFRKILQR
jgi:hypothetical protein